MGRGGRNSGGYVAMNPYELLILQNRERQQQLAQALQTNAAPVQNANGLTALAQYLGGRNIRKEQESAKQEQAQLLSQMQTSQSNALANILAQRNTPDARNNLLDASISQMQYLPQGVDPIALANALAPEQARPYTFVDGYQIDPMGNPTGVRLPKDEKPQGPITVSEGSSVFDPSTGKALYTNPKREKSDKPETTPLLTEAQYLFPNDPDKQRAFIAAGREKSKTRMRFNPNTGEFEYSEGAGGEETQKKPLTEAQGKATNFGVRMEDAEKEIADVRAKYPDYQPGNMVEKLAGAVPLVGNYAISDAGQRYRQAQENWVRAALRLESGAVITKDEMDKHISTFFEQPGDSPAVRLQKERARQGYSTATRYQAGPGEEAINARATSSSQQTGGASAQQATEKIRDAYRAGRLSREQAVGMLRELGME